MFRHAVWQKFTYRPTGLQTGWVKIKPNLKQETFALTDQNSFQDSSE
jgi:hypothetical protein